MVTKKTYSLKDIFAEQAGPGLMGSPTFSGTGNYGVGNNRQLAAISKDPSVQRVADQEEKEADQNFDDQEYRLGKFSVGGKTLLGPSDGKSKEQVVNEQPVSYGIGGGPPSLGPPNRLVKQQQFLPPEEDDADYFEPTEKIIIEDEDEKDDVESLLGDLGPKHDDELTDEDLIIFMKNLEETLFNPGATYSNRKGWNNIQINSLSLRKNHLDPEGKNDLPDTWRPIFKEPGKGHNPPAGSSAQPAKRSPLCGYGAIGWPKKFTPEDYEINRSTSFEEEEFGSDSEQPLIQNPASQNIVKEMNLLKRFIKEIFKSKAQQAYFWAKAGQGGKEGKKWKKMAKEFQGSTPKNADLPQKVDEVMTPIGDNSLGGVKAFIKSRKNVKKELNKEDE